MQKIVYFISDLFFAVYPTNHHPKMKRSRHDEKSAFSKINFIFAWRLFQGQFHRFIADWVHSIDDFDHGIKIIRNMRFLLQNSKSKQRRLLSSRSDGMYSYFHHHRTEVSFNLYKIHKKIDEFHIENAFVSGFTSSICESHRSSAVKMRIFAANCHHNTYVIVLWCKARDKRQWKNPENGFYRVECANDSIEVYKNNIKER